MRCEDEVSRSGSRAAVVSVDGALVLLLYLSLISDVIVYVRGRYPSGKKGTNSDRRFYRSTVHYMRKRHGKPYHEKKQIHSLDNLWRRMQKATNQTRLVNLQHHVITKLMMEARIQARQRERAKQQQRKVRQLAGALKS